MARAGAVLALAGCLFSCTKAPGPSTLLSEDALLTAPDGDFLAERLALVETGRYDEAQARWSTRALLIPEQGSAEIPDLGEQAWSHEMDLAARALIESGEKKRRLERLGRAYARAGWFREARSVLSRAQGFGALSGDAERLLAMATTLTRFQAATDSLLGAQRLAAGGVEPMRPGADALELARGFGLTSEALRAQKLYFGQRPVPGRPGSSDLELAVMVHHEGPFAVRLGDTEVSARRVILDDNTLTPTHEGMDWDPGSIVLVEEGSLLVYHHRSDLRRAATHLFQDLERRAGRAPDAPADSSFTALAAALRLNAALPLFDRIRAEGISRTETRRRFVLETMAARMTQVEMAGARHLIDQREHPGETSGAAAAERRLLAKLEHGPVPGLALADAVDLLAHPESADEETVAAAREVIRKLEESAADLAEPGAKARPGDPLLGLSESELRALAMMQR